MKKSIPGDTKSPSRSNPQIIRLTKIKQWYLPVDKESYTILRDAGVPLIRIPADFIPALSLLTKKHHIKAREVSFRDEILGPFLENVGTTWNKKPFCKATIGARNMKFETTKAEVYTKMKEVIPKLVEVLERFFARWGYSYTIVPSESRQKWKIDVDYFFDSNKMPIIPLATPVEEQQKIQLKIGFTRLTFTFDDFHSKSVTLPPLLGSSEQRKEHRIGYVHLLIEISQGGVFTPLHSTRCTYTELSSVKPLIAALMHVPNMDIHNFDNPA